MNSNATFLDTIMIYQSMSGDADRGTSAFTMTGGKLTSRNGHVFHVTNTSAIITLSGVEIVNEDGEGVLLSVCDDGWSGAGNVATLNARGQTLEGLLLVGSDATLTLNLTEGSVFTGTVSGAITNAKGDAVSTEVGTVHVTVEGASTWVLTGDTYIASFTGDASSIVVREEQRALPAYEKPPAWPVDVYLCRKAICSPFFVPPSRAAGIRHRGSPIWPPPGWPEGCPPRRRPGRPR